MSFFYGVTKKRSYFEGWYFKNQNVSEIISFIPSFHIDENGKKFVIIQVIINSSSYQIKYKMDEFSILKKGLGIRIGNNTFTDKGISLNICTDCIEVVGKLIYTSFVPLKYDIMGPFKYAPFMQCRHSVYSLAHNIKGHLLVNGNHIDFNNGLGYVEGDRGVEFPSNYFWTQCSWRNNGNNVVMLSVADIPIGRLKFMGCIGIVYYGGKEYRLATYLGVKIRKNNSQELWVQQRGYDLKAIVIDENPHSLLAPVKGNMTRTVHESIDCKMRYCFVVYGKVIFDFVGRGSFERGK
jgi:hypothetical protein